MHLSFRKGMMEVVKAILEAETALDLSATNFGGQTAVEAAADDEISGLIIRDRRFRPAGNPV